MKFILFFVFAFFLVGILAIPASLAQDAIPSWIKNNAGWWADDKIDDFTFAQGVGFLIKNKIIQIDDLPTTSDGEIAIENDISIPSWIKNNAGWWANDSISDSDFLYGIKFLVENSIIQFQSDLAFEETKNIEKYLLDWDTIVNDSKYAYGGSIKLQSKFFDYVNYIVTYNISKDFLYDFGEPSLLETGVWLYQITGDEQFLQNSRNLANFIEKYYLYNSGIVMNAHPLSNTVVVTDEHTNQEILSDVAKLALVDSNYVQFTKTLADAVIEHEINHETELLYSWVHLMESQLTVSWTYHTAVRLVWNLFCLHMK